MNCSAGGYAIALLLMLALLFMAWALLTPADQVASFKLPDTVRAGNDHARSKHPEAMGALEYDFNCLIQGATQWLYLQEDPNALECPRKQYGAITTPGEDGRLITIFKALSKYWKSVVDTQY